MIYLFLSSTSFVYAFHSSAMIMITKYLWTTRYFYVIYSYLVTTRNNEKYWFSALPRIRKATKKKRSIAKPRLSEGNLENFEQRKKREDFEDFMNELQIEEHRDTIENKLRENTMDKMREKGLERILEEGSKKAGGGKTSKSNKGKKGNVPQLSRTVRVNHFAGILINND